MYMYVFEYMYIHKKYFPNIVLVTRLNKIIERYI